MTASAESGGEQNGGRVGLVKTVWKSFQCGGNGEEV